MSGTDFRSWGNYPDAPPARVHRLGWRSDSLPGDPSIRPLLAYGLGRSYGDSCLNEGGTMLATRTLAHFMEFDATSGRLVCEAGVSLGEILRLVVPRGWFIPVSPGTKFVTVGGAIANDIHGKNHHRAGTFGRHLRRFELLRSDGSRRVCSAEHHPSLFHATIGGLGLTGLITWAELQLVPVASPWIDHESIRFERLDRFFDLAADSDRRFEYTVAWIDSLASGEALGRGLLLRGNHAGAGSEGTTRRARTLRIPFHAPSLLLSPWSLRLFNTAYYRLQRSACVRRTVHYEPFFYPLDGIEHWNRLYGRRGFLQYQSVVPPDAGPSATRAMLERISSRGLGSFLAVLKIFGDVPSPGLLSFPAPGATLALDFPNRGRTTLELLDELDAIVADHGGRIYPAKDARMSAESFRRFYPRWEELAGLADPAFSSSLWRRLTGNAAGSEP